jgi:hypothetical protein
MSAVRPGSAVRILIRATDLGSPITIESAAVRWSKHGEFGVEFLGLSELDQNRLHRLLHAKTRYPLRPGFLPGRPHLIAMIGCRHDLPTLPPTSRLGG